MPPTTRTIVLVIVCNFIWHSWYFLILVSTLWHFWYSLLPLSSTPNPGALRAGQRAIRQSNIFTVTCPQPCSTLPRPNKPFLAQKRLKPAFFINRQMLPTNTLVMQANVTLLVILQNFDAIGDLLKFVCDFTFSAIIMTFHTFASSS